MLDVVPVLGLAEALTDDLDGGRVLLRDRCQHTIFTLCCCSKDLNRLVVLQSLMWHLEIWLLGGPELEK